MTLFHPLGVLLCGCFKGLWLLVFPALAAGVTSMLKLARLAEM